SGRPGTPSPNPGNENGPPVRASRSQWALCPACRESYAGGVHLSTGEMVMEESMPEVPADNQTDAKPSLDATAPKRASADPDLVLVVCREIFTFFEWILVIALFAYIYQRFGSTTSAIAAGALATVLALYVGYSTGRIVGPLWTGRGHTLGLVG